MLVHGAWHGGWCFSRVSKILRNSGHDVFTPTLSGLGERSHLYSPAINASTHIQDVVNVIEYEDLSDIVLVGHSYGGQVVTGVADRLPGRIASLIYIDGFVGRTGYSTFDMDLPEAVASHIDRAQSNGGHTVPPIPSKIFGVNVADQAWVDEKCTPQPLACLAERLTFTGAYQSITEKNYIYAKGWGPSAFQGIYDELKTQPGWKIHELPCGHDTMVDMPEETAAILLAVAEGREASEHPSTLTYYAALK